MTEEPFSRSALLLGQAAQGRLQAASVALFGVGGVGSYAAEALARAGVGRITLVDPDRVAPSNLNRQLPALQGTIGEPKAQVMARRIAQIQPGCQVDARLLFYEEATAASLPLAGFDYLIDAIDTVSSKLLLICRAQAAGVPVISAMGCGNKLNPSLFRVADISQTRVCPLARVMRRELKRRGVEHLKVVYSPEPPLAPAAGPLPSGGARRSTPGSVSWVPGAAGLLLAGQAVLDLLGRPMPQGG